VLMIVRYDSVKYLLTFITQSRVKRTWKIIKKATHGAIYVIYYLLAQMTTRQFADTSVIKTTPKL